MKHLTLILILYVCLFGCKPSNQLSNDSFSILAQIKMDSNSQPIWSIDWRPGDSEIVIGGHIATYIFYIDSMNLLKLKDESGTLSSVSWNKEGNEIFGGTTSIWSWSADSQIVQTISGHPLEFRFFTQTDLSPNSLSIATIYIQPQPEPNLVQIWDLYSGQYVNLPLSQADIPVSLSWGPDSQYLAVAMSNSPSVQIWDVANRVAFQSIQSQVHTINTLTWTQDKNERSLLAIGGNEGEIEIWNISTGSVIKSFVEHKGPIYSIKWHPSGNYFATASENGIEVWQLDNDSSYVIETQRAYAVAWSHSGDWIAGTINDLFAVWDVSQIFDQTI